jgi:hypothetical protein
VLDLMCAVVGDHVDTVVECIQAKFQHNHQASAAQGPAPAAAIQGEVALVQVRLKGYSTSTACSACCRGGGGWATIHRTRGGCFVCCLREDCGNSGLRPPVPCS